jgi:hypothetical protein
MISSALNPAPPKDYSAIRSSAESARNQASSIEVQRVQLEKAIRDSKAATYNPNTSSTPGPAFEDLLKESQNLQANAPSPYIDLSKIPDPSDSELPYQFVSQDSQFTSELRAIYKNLYKANPYYENRKQAREFGLFAVEEADQASSAGDQAGASFYKELAVGFLDIAVGIDPITGIARGTYELFMGRNLITGASLSDLERGMAALNVLALGGGGAIGKLASRASHFIPVPKVALIVEDAAKLVEPIQGILRGWSKDHRIIAVHDAETVNNALKAIHPGYQDTFQMRTKVVEFVTGKESDFVRVHLEGGERGRWLMKKEALRGLTPQQIQLKYYLPGLPTHVTEVHVPANTQMYRGAVAEIQAFVPRPDNYSNYVPPEGAIQYMLKDQLTGPQVFSNTRPIGEIFK